MAELEGTTVPVIAFEDEGRLDGALKTLYSNGQAGKRHGRFQAPRPITGPSGDRAKPQSEAALKTRDAPTVGETIVEEDVLEGRFWDFKLSTQTPVLKEPEASSQPPWGTIDVFGMVKEKVPLTLVGAAQIYFNSAKYTQARLTGMLQMMDVQDLPKDQFVCFSSTSKDPLRDGYLTMWRFVSRIAYDKYYRMKMEFDKNPDRIRPRASLFGTLDKYIRQEQKEWGKGKALPKLKFPRDDGEEGEEEEEEEPEEEDEEGSGDGKGFQRLQDIMGMTEKGLNGGEWGTAFGFFTESDVYRVYRLWSRPVYHPLPPPTKVSAEEEW